MEIQRQNGTLTVHDVQELSAVNARWFRNEICAALSPGLKEIEIDLTHISHVDSCGLGALVSVFKAANDRVCKETVTLRLLNLQPPVQQMFELTRMHHLFEIVPRNGGTTNGQAPVNHAAKPTEPK
ncbi:MAG TPA: STAS domain-containing protein [Verrucomicrobiae bacterium]|nr:STAS domain-containing protein [Verrucomicrobiae bacterium]